jgi:pyruvate/2-oxoglutarate dehydrogenase complex dihydrolipoamide acyltransferase (E2) component
MPETTEISVAAAPVAAAPEPAAPAPTTGSNPARTVDDAHILVPPARHLVGSKGFDASLDRARAVGLPREMSLSKSIAAPAATAPVAAAASAPPAAADAQWRILPFHKQFLEVPLKTLTRTRCARLLRLA